MNPSRAVPDVVRNFDWFKLPGAVRAVATVVGTSADALSAWIDVAKAAGEQRAQGIRDITKARTELIQSTAQTLSERVSGDSGLQSRMIDRLLREELRKQENREAVARHTIEFLKESATSLDVNPSHTKEIDDNWLNVFATWADKATTEQMRVHWARVLSGEIRRPGSISLRTLSIMSVVDQELASMMSRASGWLFDDFIPEAETFKGDRYTVLAEMAALGVLISDVGAPFPLEHGTLTMEFEGAKIVIQVADTSQREIDLYGAFLTAAGEEVFSIIPKQHDREAIDLIAEGLQRHPDVKSLEVVFLTH
jgi:hypothetical protein